MVSYKAIILPIQRKILLASTINFGLEIRKEDKRQSDWKFEQWWFQLDNLLCITYKTILL